MLYKIILSFIREPWQMKFTKIPKILPKTRTSADQVMNFHKRQFIDYEKAEAKQCLLEPKLWTKESSAVPYLIGR